MKNILIKLKRLFCLCAVSGSTLKQKPIWSDYYLNKYRWYRKCRKQTWYKHQFTKDARELTFLPGDTWWARYGKLNRYSDVVCVEYY